MIGVEEVRGGRSKVVGITQQDHLQDHTLQQFVNNKTNHPVRFQYETLDFEGKQIGIIRIEQQPKPIYLKRDYGKLQREMVYVRRGTSTDPRKPASPDDIAQMGLAVPQTAELVFEFSETEKETALGTRISLGAEFLEIPVLDQIPDLNSPCSPHPIVGLDFSELAINPLNRTNPDYYRELAMFHFIRCLFRPVRLVLRNTGQVNARNIRCELALTYDEGTCVRDSVRDQPSAMVEAGSGGSFPVAM